MGLDLTARKIRDSFPLLLQCGNDQAEGLDATLRAVADGKGQDSVLDLSTGAARLRTALRLAGVSAPGAFAGEGQIYADLAGLLRARTPGLDFSLAPPSHPGFATGAFYTQWGGLRDGSSFTLTANRLYSAPLFVPDPKTLTKIGIYVDIAGGAGTVIRLGLYANANGRPGALRADFGTVTADSAAEKNINISHAIEPGWYWMAHLSDGGPRCVAVDTTFGGSLHWLFGGSAALGTQNLLYRDGISVAALPDPFGTPSALSVSRQAMQWVVV